MIAIVDYGVGNLFSLRSSLRYLGLAAEVTADADTLRRGPEVSGCRCQVPPCGGPGRRPVRHRGKF